MTITQLSGFADDRFEVSQVEIDGNSIFFLRYGTEDDHFDGPWVPRTSLIWGPCTVLETNVVWTSSEAGTTHNLDPSQRFEAAEFGVMRSKRIPIRSSF